jgi:hypothetical protein
MKFSLLKGNLDTCQNVHFHKVKEKHKIKEKTFTGKTNLKNNISEVICMPG